LKVAHPADPGRSRKGRGGLWPSLFLPGALFIVGCSLIRFPDPPDPSLLVLVAPVVMEAPIKKPTDIHSFEVPPPEDVESAMLARLAGEVEREAQRLLIEHLARQPGFRVVPFEEVRRLTAGLRVPGQRIPEPQLLALGRQLGADLVVTASIDDYGRLQWHHWAFGWLSVASTHTAIVCAATAWNPLAMGAYLAWDLTTDFPLWYGGAYVLGWAFRPVHVIVEATQLEPCGAASFWRDEEVVIIAGKKALAAYPEDQRARKEIQLRVNLEQAMQNVAERAGKTLRLGPCEEKDERPGSRRRVETGPRDPDSRIGDEAALPGRQGENGIQVQLRDLRNGLGE